jgi:D-alanine transaminase
MKTPVSASPNHQHSALEGICYLNGHFGPLAEAKISVMDRGFIFGDAVYEVIPAYKGKLFQFDAHMDRLERSLGEVFIQQAFERAEWRSIFEHLILENAALHHTPKADFNASIYLQISRGVAPRDHVIPHFIEPTIFAMCQALPAINPLLRETGVFCITHEDFRWKKAHIKTTSLIGSILAKRLSVNQKAAETVMFRDGLLSEASSSNVWVVKGGEVIGTPKGPLVLEGIRYGVLSQLCAANSIPFVLKAQTKEDVFNADELLLTSASKEILPITRLDEHPIANGRPGPIYRQLFEAYQALKQHE